MPCDFPYARHTSHACTHTYAHKHNMRANTHKTHSHTHSTVQPALILWFSSPLQSELPCFHCSHGLWVTVRLSQAICAGSHWLTHLGPGNTPIPTYPCIHQEWPASKSWQSDGIHFCQKHALDVQNDLRHLPSCFSLYLCCTIHILAVSSSYLCFLRLSSYIELKLPLPIIRTQYRRFNKW